MVILYGDWGRRPNLKHQAPSPGIGLRRLLHGYQGKSGERIITLTVRETYTSSFDPDTGRPVTKARFAGWPVGFADVGEARGVHALLREDPDPSVPPAPEGGYTGAEMSWVV